MKNMILKFKEEHKQLSLEFQRLSREIPSRESKFTVKDIHDRLFSHLERENKELYPHIEKAVDNPKARIAAASFKSVYEIISGLKEVCEDIAAGRERFNIPTRELHNHLLNLFIQRFKSEEEHLFSNLLPDGGRHV